MDYFMSHETCEWVREATEMMCIPYREQQQQHQQKQKINGFFL